ncbi:protein kinase domain-containing protein [Ktedonobacter robiniae]|uniref:Protein kinase domain-containing protein n=1 Tax=Ktedonobacter robiniae TaxID=2778365 RepID=A0ABQ3UMX8_9CHLR|nr:protein kinase [Ktedonobacter robiniae]GHO53972.1 hypothetical protein KSB_24470 [Ktedonobacter robiniae]
MPGNMQQPTHSQASDSSVTYLHNGDYQIQRILGRGGMGKVLLATHTRLGTPFAIKQALADSPLAESAVAELEQVLHPDDVIADPHPAPPGRFPVSGGEHTDRFTREALLLLRLQHPAIPTLYDYFHEHGSWHLVMDYVPGISLNNYLSQHAPLPPLEALNYATQLCDVLAYLHQQQPPVIYRDLKPSNIMLMPNGMLMLIDYGIARYYKEGQSTDTTGFGSPGYASPEQYNGGSQTDGRSDLFSLGVILHEMLTGQRVAPSALMKDEPRPIQTKVSSALQGLVNLATRPDPAQRYQNASLFAQALERVYAIEERAAYEERLSHIHAFPTPSSSLQAARKEDQATGLHQDLNAGDNLASSLVPLSLSSVRPSPAFLAQILDGRRQTRQHLQRLRRQGRHPTPRPFSPPTPTPQPRNVPTPRPQYRPTSSTATNGIPAALAVNASAKQTRSETRALTLLMFALLLLLLISASVAYFYGTPFLLSQAGSPGDNPNPPGAESLDIGHIASWHQLASPPVPVADNASMFAQVEGHSYVYMTGGYRGPKQNPKYDRHLYRYDISSGRWEQAPTTNGAFPGMLNNAIAHDTYGNLLFANGYSTDTYSVSSALYQYQLADGSLNKIIPSQDIPLGFGLSMLTDQQGDVYLTQGFSKAGAGQTVAGTGWYRYTPHTGQWQALAPLPQGLGYVMLALTSQNQILLLGGASDAAQAHPSNAIYRYDSAHNAWHKEQATLPTPLSGSSSCAPSSDQLVMLGGFDATHNSSLARSWLLDLKTLHASALPDIPNGGSLLGTATCDTQGHFYLLRGTRDPGIPTADFMQLTLTLPHSTQPQSVPPTQTPIQNTPTQASMQNTPTLAPGQNTPTEDTNPKEPIGK